MFNIRLSQVVIALARQFILTHNTVAPDIWNKRDRALRFVLRADVDFYAGEDQKFPDRSGVRMMHVIITSRHRVYIAQNDGSITWVPKAEDYINVSNHNSCWSDAVDSDFTSAYFECAAFVHAGQPDKPPRDMHQHCSFGAIRGPVFEYVSVEFGPKLKDNNYFDTLTKITPVTFRVEFNQEPENEQDQILGASPLQGVSCSVVGNGATNL